MTDCIETLNGLLLRGNPRGRRVLNVRTKRFFFSEAGNRKRIWCSTVYHHTSDQFFYNETMEDRLRNEVASLSRKFYIFGALKDTNDRISRGCVNRFAKLACLILKFLRVNGLEFKREEISETKACGYCNRRFNDYTRT